MTSSSALWNKVSLLSGNQGRRVPLGVRTVSPWKHKKLSPNLRMLKKILRIKTLERLGIGLALIFLGSFWFINESQQVIPNSPPTLIPKDYGRETVFIITAAPKSHEAGGKEPGGTLIETHPKRKTKKKSSSKFKNSPVNWIDNSEITDGIEDDVTIVTAYINLGRYNKGGVKFIPDEYREWMKVFGKIENPVVAFINDKNDLALFNKIREELPNSKSKTEHVTKESLWGYDFTKNITELFSKKEYENVKKPPGYVSVRHSKYDFMGTALKYNYFQTKYYCWLDMDFFKDIVSSVQKPFSLHIPNNFDQDRIAYSEHFPRQNFSLPEIFQQNKTWVSGSAFLGRASVMRDMVKQYATYTEMFINNSYINADTQVTYAMYQSTHNPPVSIQVYPVSDRYKPGEQLGYLMLESGSKRKGNNK